MARVEEDLRQFIVQYEHVKENFDQDLDMLERDLATMERLIQIKVGVRILSLSSNENESFASVSLVQAGRSSHPGKTVERSAGPIGSNTE